MQEIGAAYTSPRVVRLGNAKPCLAQVDEHLGGSQLDPRYARGDSTLVDLIFWLDNTTHQAESRSEDN